jgi:hypothetical protein
VSTSSWLGYFSEHLTMPDSVPAPPYHSEAHGLFCFGRRAASASE